MKGFRSNPAFPVLCLAVGLMVCVVPYTMGQTENDEGATLAEHEIEIWGAIHTSVEATKALLDEGLDPNYKFGNGTPLLHVAITGRATDPEAVVRVLLDYGADPNLMSRGGITALHVAAGFSNAGYSITKLLLERGGDPLRKSITPEGEDGLTPYYYALAHGFVGAQKAIEEVTDYRPADYKWRKITGILRGELYRALDNARNDKQRKFAWKAFLQKQVLHGLITKADADAQYNRLIETGRYKPLKERDPERWKRETGESEGRP